MASQRGLRSYQELKVWHLAMDIAVEVYRLTQTYPKEETYGLTSQLRRSASSISANIAEGSARSSTKEFLRHISIAMGSLAELETLLLLSQRLGLGNSEHIEQLLTMLDEEGRMLRGLQHSLRRKLQPSN